MIIWIASYPKSGNTWLRTLISSYYYSKDGTFHSDLIQQIGQFPEKRHFESFNYDNKSVIGTTQFWIKAQEKINQDQNIRFFKTHNVYGKINDNHFTNKQNSLGCIYIVRDPRSIAVSNAYHEEVDFDYSVDFDFHQKYPFSQVNLKIYNCNYSGFQCFVSNNSNDF